MGFVRKVLGIVSVQMVWTFFCAVLGAVMKDRIGHQVNKPGVIILMLIGVIGFSLWLYLSDEARRTVPKNYIILGAFTFCEGVLFVGLTSKMEVQAVIMSILALAVITTVLYFTVIQLKDFELFHRVMVKALFASVFIHLAILALLISMGLMR